ncbi:ATP-binding protein [Ectobacillus sp. JY-23]|uniref:sensor histidine kinase n=1 Tax=Ectobacillus sp. JY-23 TaxID=2933872 RepID=UPI001FF28AD8|nr:ATP-binding protein [Ectobacillus sp. JY-23]UOY92610.1 ATP-binding protein [Ectobacillus sp. JY-23]
MKRTMVQKLWLTISAVAVITASFLYVVSLYSYEKLYVQNVEGMMVAEGKRLASRYDAKKGSAHFSQQVADFDALSESNIMFVDNPRDLSACLPFEIQYNPIVSEDDRQHLLHGDTITKSGYEPRFDRNITGTVIPVLDEKRLVGILYVYIPLKSVKDLIVDLGWILAPLSILLIVTAAWIGRKIVLAVTKPLLQMERISYKMSGGDFSQRIEITSSDEVGKLASAFNSMASALEREDLHRKEFLANISHELRTPLSYIKGYSEAILDGVAKEDPNKYIGLIHREAGRMERLVHDLLDLARLEGELFPLQKQPTVFAQLIEDELALYEPQIQEKGLRLVQQLDPDVIADLDEDRIRQVIHNLMDNALRYTEQGEIKVCLTQNKEKCMLMIRDSGIGIAPEHVNQLGERFYRVDKARSRQSGGTGLGLAIVKQIAEIHGGTIQIESEQGVGTSIILELPVISI